MASLSEQALDIILEILLLQGEQKSIHQGYYLQKLHSVFPKPEPTRLQTQLGFSETQALFYVPAAGISLYQLPGLIIIFYFFIGKQIPRLADFATGSADDERERAVLISRLPAALP
jgi:hypothetical protein